MTSITVTEAVEVLHHHRHSLPSDALRSLRDIWFCASAARFGEPYEGPFDEDADFFRTHDVSRCEADDQPGELDDDAPVQGPAEGPDDAANPWGATVDAILPDPDKADPWANWRDPAIYGDRSPDYERGYTEGLNAGRREHFPF